MQCYLASQLQLYAYSQLSCIGQLASYYYTQLDVKLCNNLSDHYRHSVLFVQQTSQQWWCSQHKNLSAWTLIIQNIQCKQMKDQIHILIAQTCTQIGHAQQAWAWLRHCQLASSMKCCSYCITIKFTVINATIQLSAKLSRWYGGAAPKSQLATQLGCLAF